MRWTWKGGGSRDGVGLPGGWKGLSSKAQHREGKPVTVKGTSTCTEELEGDSLHTSFSQSQFQLDCMHADVALCWAEGACVELAGQPLWPRSDRSLKQMGANASALHQSCPLILCLSGLFAMRQLGMEAVDLRALPPRCLTCLTLAQPCPRHLWLGPSVSQEPARLWALGLALAESMDGDCLCCTVCSLLHRNQVWETVCPLLLVWPKDGLGALSSAPAATVLGQCRQ